MLFSILFDYFHEYNISTWRWVWDEDNVSSMDITGNVLYLLSSKMSGLSTSIQSALKIAACFCIKIEQSAVAALSTNPEHSDIQDKLEQVVKEGFMIRCGTSDLSLFMIRCKRQHTVSYPRRTRIR